MKLKQAALSAAIVFLLGGCATANFFNQSQKQYKKGNYYLSAVNTVEVLKLDKSHEKALAFLPTVFPLAAEELLLSIEKSAARESDPYRWDQVVRDYENLHSLNDDLRFLEPLTNPEDGTMLRFEYRYSYDALEQARENAAAVYYEDAVRLMKEKDRDRKKDAVRNFEKALSYVSGYRDAVRLMQETQQEALQRVLFLPFENISMQFAVNVADIIQDEIIVSILNDEETRKFTSIVDRDQFENILAEHDLILSGFFNESDAVQIGGLVSANLIAIGQITQINYDPGSLTSSTVIREVDLNADIEGAQPQLVQAMVQTFQKTASVEMYGMYKIIDMESGLVDHADTFQETVESRAEYLEVQGDFRALSDADLLKLKNNTYDVKIAEEMISDLARQVGASIASDLKNYLQ